MLRAKRGLRDTLECIGLTGPLGGFKEIDKVIKHTQGYLSYADEVKANIIGVQH